MRPEIFEMKAEDLRKCQKVKVGRMRDKKIKIERVKELWIKFAFQDIQSWGACW